jgi:hypothetical protein
MSTEVVRQQQQQQQQLLLLLHSAIHKLGFQFLYWFEPEDLIALGACSPFFRSLTTSDTSELFWRDVCVRDFLFSILGLGEFPYASWRAFYLPLYSLRTIHWISVPEAGESMRALRTDRYEYTSAEGERGDGRPARLFRSGGHYFFSISWIWASELAIEEVEPAAEETTAATAAAVGQGAGEREGGAGADGNATTAAAPPLPPPSSSSSAAAAAVAAAAAAAAAVSAGSARRPRRVVSFPKWRKVKGVCSSAVHLKGSGAR